MPTRELKTMWSYDASTAAFVRHQLSMLSVMVFPWQVNHSAEAHNLKVDELKVPMSKLTFSTNPSHLRLPILTGLPS